MMTLNLAEQAANGLSLNARMVFFIFAAILAVVICGSTLFWGKAAAAFITRHRTAAVFFPIAIGGIGLIASIIADVIDFSVLTSAKPLSEWVSIATSVLIILCGLILSGLWIQGQIGFQQCREAELKKKNILLRLRLREIAGVVAKKADRIREKLETGKVPLTTVKQVCDTLQPLDQAAKDFATLYSALLQHVQSAKLGEESDLELAIFVPDESKKCLVCAIQYDGTHRAMRERWSAIEKYFSLSETDAGDIVKSCGWLCGNSSRNVPMGLK